MARAREVYAVTVGDLLELLLSCCPHDKSLVAPESKLGHKKVALTYDLSTFTIRQLVAPLTQRILKTSFHLAFLHGK